MTDTFSSTRRRLTASLLLAPLAMPWSSSGAEPRFIRLWTGQGCECCHHWVEHLRASGFDVETHDGGNDEARTRLGMPAAYRSCHSGEIEGYALEGHVPSREINRLLEERLGAIGLSVPGMPRGSPGMEGHLYHNVKDAYDVLLVRRNGSAIVYQSYR